MNIRLLVVLNYLFFIHAPVIIYSQGINTQYEMYMQAAQKYDAAASKTSCPNNKSCYQQYAKYLRGLAASLRSPNGPPQPSDPGCLNHLVSCPQDANGNPIGKSGSGASVSGSVSAPGLPSGLAEIGAVTNMGLSLLQEAGSNNPKGVKMINMAGTVSNTVAQLGGGAVFDQIGSTLGFLGNIGGLFAGRQQEEQQAEEQSKIEAQRKAEEQQRIQQQQQMIAAYNAQVMQMQQQQKQFDAKIAEYEALIKKEKERTFTAEDWFKEAGKNDINTTSKIDMLTMAIQKDGNYLPAIEQRGLTYYKEIGNYDNAAVDFATAIRLKSINPDIYWYAGEIGYGAKQYDLAVLYYSRAFELKPALMTQDNLEKRALSYYSMGAYDKCLADYTAILQLNSTDKRILYQKAKIEFFNQQYEVSKQSFSQLIKLDNNVKEYYYYKGFTEMNLKEYSIALGDFNTAIRIDNKYADAYYLRGYVKYQMNDFTGSKDDFTQSIWFSNNNPLFYYYRASSEFNLGEYEKAAKDAEDALAFNPTFKDAFLLFAHSQEKISVNKSELQQWFSKVNEEQSKISNYYYHMATYYALNQKKSVSLDWLDKAVKSGLSDFISVQKDPMMDNVKTERRFGFIIGN
ncbi:MAG: tetratricopeptide repeat protein [Chitinophagales bacterium]